MTGPDVIVNDVYVDPADSNHVLLATDRGGVLAERRMQAPALRRRMQGISERKVEALLVDRDNPARIFAGVVNDKTYGGVFVSTDGGAQWKQIGRGARRARCVCARADTGWHGAGRHQQRHLRPAIRPRRRSAAGRSPATWSREHDRQHARQDGHRDASRHARQRGEAGEGHPASRWTAASTRSTSPAMCGSLPPAGGLFTSRDQGATWQGGPVMGVVDYLSVTVHGALMAAARPMAWFCRKDGGQTLVAHGHSHRCSRAFIASPSRRMARSGWARARASTLRATRARPGCGFIGFRFVDVDDLYYDAHLKKVLVSSRSSDLVYAIDPKTLDWKWWQTGYRLSAVRAAGDRLLAASLDDGVLVEPQRGRERKLGRR